MGVRREDDDGRAAGDGDDRVFFGVTRGFEQADGTIVYPFLNGNDAKSGLPRGLPEAFSMTIGVIEPEQSSRIHVHPVVTQVTMVLDGVLDVCVGGPSMAPRTVQLAQNQAVLVRPGTFLQLVNRSVLPCRTLYVVGPAYVADVDEHDHVRYEDAVALDESWEQLAALDWRPERLRKANVTPRRRKVALGRVREGQAARERRDLP